MPDDVSRKVIADVALYARLPPESLAESDVLRDLGIDHFGFLAIASSLRTFIQFANPAATLRVREVEKNGLTLGGLIAIVKERISP